MCAYILAILTTVGEGSGHIALCHAGLVDRSAATHQDYFFQEYVHINIH